MVQTCYIKYLLYYCLMSVKVVSSSFVISSPSLALCPPSSLPEFVFIGRSNVGKSSLINALCDKKQLAKTSGQPGKTQLINYFHIESLWDDNVSKLRHLVDLPWYWYAKVTREERAGWEKMTNEYFTHRKQIAHIFVLIDSRLSPQKNDIAFIQQLHAYWHTFSLVYTKTDKVTQKDVSHTIKLMEIELSKTMPIPQCFVTSAERRQSTYKLVEAIHAMV